MVAPVRAISVVECSIPDRRVPIRAVEMYEEMACQVNGTGNGLQRTLALTVSRVLGNLVDEEAPVLLIQFFLQHSKESLAQRLGWLGRGLNEGRNILRG
jgi:hypothetical protein